MSGIKIRGLEFCQQKLVPAKHVQGQIAVAIEIAMEEPALLMTMKRIIGGIQIQNDFFGDLSGGLDKGINKELIDCFFGVVYLFVLLVFLFSDSVGFQAIQRALAGQGIPTIPSVFPFAAGRIQFSAYRGQQRITTQLIMIVGVFIAKA